MRRLAAVWFADIVGFTELSSRDEDVHPVPVPADIDRATTPTILGAGILAMLGQPDSAMAILQSMYEDGNPNLREAGVEPWLAPLHDDPRFVALLDRIGLAPVTAARTWMKRR